MNNLERIRAAEQDFNAQGGPTIAEVLRGKYGQPQSVLDDESREPEQTLLNALASGPSWLDDFWNPHDPMMGRNILARQRLLLLGLIEACFGGWRTKEGDA